MSRKVRIATVAQLHRGGPTVQHNRELISTLIVQAVAERPDIICLPETFLQQGVAFDHLNQVAEPIPGPTTDLVSAYARENQCYIICPLIGAHDERFTNDAVLIDREGAIQGIYSKLHPVVQGATFTCLEQGVTPGRSAPVFQTDFGRIGIQICFDIWFDDGWFALKRGGAEIVFWASAYDAGRHLSMRAWAHRVYVVSAVQARYARIVDVMGDVRAITGPGDPVTAHTVDLDVGLFHADFNNVQVPLIRTRYGTDVTIRMWHEEGVFSLETNRDDLSVADLIAEFELDPLETYLERNARLQDAVRAGRPIPEDLAPPYSPDRVQWV
ncbi:MAG: carbon-nitrogen hydrolase family protein [Chloroflexi bacterium]|nr:carbon-nitrogen hydrolase family protein [Chloroflexota bacterium]